MKNINPSQPKNQSAKIHTEVPGPKSRTLREREARYLAPGLQGFASMAGIVVDSASGSAVTDVDGNVFIDLIGGIGVNGLGHTHPKWVQAIEKQLIQSSVGSFTTMARVELMEKLAQNSPAPGLNRPQLYSGGSEAVESALRLAKCFTGKNEFVSFWGGFHGKTLGALSLMGSEFKNQVGPMVSGSHLVPYANCYRCPIGLKSNQCGMACVELATKQAKMSSSGNVAAVIVEPMQGTAGNVIPPDQFLPAVREMSRKLGALLIVDEMITGFGRTGKYWGLDHSGVRPDIVTLGKQFGGGYPVSALLSSDEIVEAKPWGNPSGSSSSYGGNPLAAMAALSSISIIEEENLVLNSERMGGILLRGLKEMEDRYGFIGEARGRGLFLALELVKDKNSKEPLSSKACAWIFQECLKQGLLTMSYASSFRIQPAMTIDEGTVSNALSIMDEVFTRAEASQIVDL